MSQVYKNIDISELFDAWYRFRKGKSNKNDVLIFENHLESNIFDLYDDLISGGYEHSGYIFFQVFDSKKRSIHKAVVRDRVIHEFLRYKLEKEFEKYFIRDSFASRKNKGSLKAVNKFKYYLGQSKYTISLDVKKYFESISHQVLLDKISQKFDANSIEYNLSKIIIESFNKNNKGIPLGNSVSQVFSNIYLSDFDWFMVKKYTYYIRYNDDIRVCVYKCSRSQIKEIIAYLEKNLFLEIPKNKIKVQNNFQGIEFLGNVVFKNFCFLNRKTRVKILERANYLNKNSYLGLLSKHNNYDFSLKLKSRYNIQHK